ncbi:MAG: serine/threonine protein kinase, partial [Deltaproteobacteria bacterium]|nr:serine/threonine protein kinase [Deltaproteobacteria bacterium]
MSEAVVDGALVLAGRYALRDPIAKGGMAVVWRASDLRLHRDVAVKVLTQSEDGDHDRVLREARLLAATGHPSIVQVLDVGVDAGRPFIVMELLEGASLDRTLARGPVAAPEALTILAAALDGLSVVHARGIVHRDLKPENLFLARDPSVPDDGSLLGGKRLKILDFGVSRATDRRTEVRSALTTREGALVGTPEYMAPEQARGLPEVGPAADLHALGVILFELLTLQRPYQSPNPGDLIIAIATQPPPLLSDLRPDLPASLGALIRRALAKSPDDRFASAQAMRAAVQEVRDELGRARVPSTPDGVAVRPAAPSDERSEAITVDGVTPLAAGLLAPERAALDTPPAEPAS